MTPSSLNTGTQCKAHIVFVRGTVLSRWCTLRSLRLFSLFLPLAQYLSLSLLLYIHLDKFDKDANWWIHCLTSNYLSRWYTYTIHSVVEHQRAIEKDLFAKQAEIEQHAVTLSQNHGRYVHSCEHSTSLRLHCEQ